MATPVLGASQSYTVVRGDTLSSISQREGVGTSQLVRLNHLRSADFLREGQVLQIVAKPSKRNLGISSGKAAALRAIAKHAHAVATSRASASTSARLAQRRALWVAMHTGFSTPDLKSNSFAAAKKAIALELRLTRTALRYLGVPYAWGGESFNGVDCSGFVQAVFRRNGIELPRTADAQFIVGRRVSERGLEPGDLVFFQTYAMGASHVGIYLGRGRFVHASSSNGVRVDSLSEDYYSSHFIGARRAAI
ncbi:MAG TPA: NlpC/P60 family protein [Candidatus Eremiobacteraceae bacterium]|nr:NlpC/P60 family protein [Candidatus Eremiobacteraceae bacterium]